MGLWFLACSAQSASSPLLHITRTPAEPDVQGTIVELISAGGYQYLRVENRWFATLRHEVSVGQRVHLDPIGVAPEFTSQRTGRHFTDLWFAAVVQSDIP